MIPFDMESPIFFFWFVLKQEDGLQTGTCLADRQTTSQNKIGENFHVGNLLVIEHLHSFVCGVDSILLEGDALSDYIGR